jgi:hypothetical protein
MWKNRRTTGNKHQLIRLQPRRGTRPGKYPNRGRIWKRIQEDVQTEQKRRRNQRRHPWKRFNRDNYKKDVNNIRGEDEQYNKWHQTSRD